MSISAKSSPPSPPLPHHRSGGSLDSNLKSESPYIYVSCCYRLRQISRVGRSSKNTNNQLKVNSGTESDGTSSSGRLHCVAISYRKSLPASPSLPLSFLFSCQMGSNWVDPREARTDPAHRNTERNGHGPQRRRLRWLVYCLLFPLRRRGTRWPKGEE